MSINITILIVIYFPLNNRDPDSVYDFFKKLATEICLSVFLDIDFHTSQELASDVVDLTTLHWHGTQSRDAIFPDFSGIPDFHKSKLSMKNL